MSQNVTNIAVLCIMGMISLACISAAAYALHTNPTSSDYKDYLTPVGMILTGIFGWWSRGNGNVNNGNNGVKP